ncbi:hypothetical protein ABRT01_14060, partial [Lentibacillus sp. L22]
LFSTITIFTYQYQPLVLVLTLNYNVQVNLQKLPLIFNKPITIIFVFILAMQFIIAGTIFTY